MAVVEVEEVPDRDTVFEVPEMLDLGGVVSQRESIAERSGRATW